MNPTNQRRCLYALSGFLLVGAGCAILWAVSPISHSPGITSVNERNTDVDSSSRPAAPPTGIAPVSLRGPLYDPAPKPAPAPPPTPVTPPPAPRPQLDVTLVGTIIDSDGPLAILADPSGKFDVKGVGEALELDPPGVTIKSIESEKVTLQYRGRDTTVTLDRTVKRQAGGGNRQNNRRRNDR